MALFLSTKPILLFFHQRPGIDFHDTFSPVVKPTMIHLILNLSLHHGWSIKQLDVKKAFLYGTLTKEVYMS